MVLIIEKITYNLSLYLLISLQTDTASVLNEAVEYIKFLQEQVTVSSSD